ncbi:MAG: hypothetical protein JWO66_678, partial [Candidatus Eremiobacteraeota bacterium]|nr:hypothetical protein [Candidatus Eremiobacteraeota bacterium]
MRTARILAAATAAALLAACGGGGGASKPAVVPQVGAPTNQGGLSPSSTSFKYVGSSALNGATVTGPVQLGTMKVDVQMALPNVAALHQYAQSVGDPASGMYRKFLTPEEIGNRFGASDADYNAAIEYFKAEGLQVTSWKQKSALRVFGPQDKMEHAFGTTFAAYKRADGDTYGPTALPHFSKPLAVHSVSQLVYNPKWTKRNAIVVPPHGTTPAFNFGIPPQQLAAAFDYSGAYAAGYTGTNINIGIIGTGPIDVRDYNGMKTKFGLGWYDNGGGFHATTNTTVQVNVQAPAGVNGGTPATPPPVTAPCSGPLPSCNPEDFEAQIDTQQTAALAPTSNVLFYLAYVPHENYGTTTDYGPQLGISEVNDEVQQAINDNQADILSLSYGLAEQYSDYTMADGTTFDPNGLEPVQFAMLQSMGIAVFVSSGDAGAQGCARPFYGTGPGIASPNQPCVSAPAIDPNVTSVGGITAPIDEAGKKIGPYTTWGIQTEHGFGATGGGCSVAIAKPAYQANNGVTLCGSKRAQPDASLDADPATGVAIAVNLGFPGQGGYTGAGGTSVAAPEMAAMWA